jgi:S1-C subfamily serine protease
LTAAKLTVFGLGMVAALVCQGCPLSLGLFAQKPSATSPVLVSPTSASPTSKPAAAGPKPEMTAAMRFLQQRSRLITVKVLANETWGSGVLIQRQGQRYLVLTNQHVLQTGKKLQVQTADGRIHTVNLFPQADFQGNDLALLQFESTVTYPVAPLGRASSLKAGHMVFASGFPLKPEGSNPDGFVFTQGQVSLVNPKSFEGGYRVGYSNPVVKGMSGGPVLNSQGALVAVNGMHAYPLWGNPYVFVDGTSPPSSQQNLLTRSSWGIPVETFLNLAPKSLDFAHSHRGSPAVTTPPATPNPRPALLRHTP